MNNPYKITHQTTISNLHFSPNTLAIDIAFHKSGIAFSSHQTCYFATIELPLKYKLKVENADGINNYYFYFLSVIKQWIDDLKIKIPIKVILEFHQFAVKGGVALGYFSYGFLLNLKRLFKEIFNSEIIMNQYLPTHWLKIIKDNLKDNKKILKQELTLYQKMHSSTKTSKNIINFYLTKNLDYDLSNLTQDEKDALGLLLADNLKDKENG